MSTLIKPKARPGTISKAVLGARTLNFSESGGDWCHRSCQMHPSQGGGCYAVHTERLKPSIKLSGERRRETGFVQTCKDLAVGLMKARAKSETIPWLRFSSFGSVKPHPNEAERSAFKALLRVVKMHGCPVHFPVEDKAKWRAYQALCEEFGITVRLTAQSLDSLGKARREGIPTSYVVRGGATKRDRLKNAEYFARHLRKRGTRALVCPAIKSTILKKDRKVKCGQCTACAESKFETILYPEH